MSIHAPGAGGRNSGVVAMNHQSAEYLYGRLPKLYRNADQQMGQTVPVVESQLPDLDTSEVASAHREEFQLQRFLRLAGSVFDWLRTLTDAGKLEMDPELCQAKYLAALASKLGWDLNEELPVPAQRLEVLSIAELYKRKGRIAALEYLISRLTDFSVTIQRLKDRVFILADPGSTYPVNPDCVFPDPAELALTGGTRDDTSYYLYGDNTVSGLNYAVNALVLYIAQNVENPDFDLLTEKLERVLPKFTPFNTDVIIALSMTSIETGYAAALEVTDDVEQHYERWKTDDRAVLRLWAPPTDGALDGGVIYDSDNPDSSYPLWYNWFREESWSHAES